jgi:two-component system, OmpR family, sensor histidine kinase TctE
VRASESLRRGLIRRLVPALAAIGLIGVIPAYVLGHRYATLAYDRALLDSVVALAGQVSLRNDALQVDLPPEARKLLAASDGEQVRFRVIDLRSGKVIVANGELGPPPEEPPVPGQPSFRDAQIGTTSFRVASASYLIDIEDVPALVEVAETLGKRNGMTRQILAATVLLVTTIIAVAVLLVWQGVGRALAPLRLLEAEAAERSGTNLTPLNADAAPEEVRGLITSINRMMGRVSDSIDSQRRFIANAAHQLRTPISGLRLQAQLALKKEPPPAVRAHVREIDESAARAGHLIEQMLTLSRAEARELIETGERVDLTELAYSTIGRYLPWALDKGIDVGFEGVASGVHITGNEVLLRELLANLVDNAIRYGRVGERVTVSVIEEEDAIVLCVTDDGPGISTDDRETVFQRFHRADSSVAHGAGLGLAIVKEIGDRHEARVSLESTGGPGCRFCVRFRRPASSEVERSSPRVQRTSGEKPESPEQGVSGETSRHPAGAGSAMG